MEDIRMNNMEKIVKILTLNHDGKIIEIKRRDNQLYMKVEIERLAKIVNENYSVMNYKISGCSKLILMIYCENNKKYTDIDVIEKMKLEIINARKRRNYICINVVKNQSQEGKMCLRADDIIICDQNDVEMDYDDLYALCEKCWNRRSL
jgi:hypothetical protein